MDFIINNEELKALCGLPYLQQLAYLRGIKPYMDIQTSIVGIKRGISYQSIAEQLYIEPHQGIKGGTCSRDQVRRAIASLERAGLVIIQSQEFKLILKCPLATRDYYVQNKAATNPPQQAAIFGNANRIENKEKFTDIPGKADIAETEKAATPHNNNYLYIFLLQQFEKFWNAYPEKKSKPKALEAFLALNPDQSLCEQIHTALKNQIDIVQQQQAEGKWVSSWKYPANWLIQRCWEDEVGINNTKEINYEKRTGNYAKSEDLLWDSCKAGLTTDTTQHNVITFSEYRKKSQAN